MRPGQRPFLARMRALANGWPATAPEAVGQATSSSGCKLLIPSTPTSDFRTGWWQADWRGGVVRPVRYLGRARRLPFRGGPRHVAAIPGQQDDATWPAEHCMASQWQCPVVYRWSGLPPRHHPETFQVGLNSIATNARVCRQRKCLSSRTTGVCDGRTISAARQRGLRSRTRATAAPCACTSCLPGHAKPPLPVKAVLIGVSLWRRLLPIFRGNTDET